jgi:hypothetical protein
MRSTKKSVLTPPSHTHEHHHYAMFNFHQNQLFSDLRYLFELLMSEIKLEQTPTAMQLFLPTKPQLSLNLNLLFKEPLVPQHAKKTSLISKARNTLSTAAKHQSATNATITKPSSLGFDKSHTTIRGAPTVQTLAAPGTPTSPQQPHQAGKPKGVSAGGLAVMFLKTADKNKAFMHTKTEDDLEEERYMRTGKFQIRMRKAFLMKFKQKESE